MKSGCSASSGSGGHSRVGSLEQLVVEAVRGPRSFGQSIPVWRTTTIVSSESSSPHVLVDLLLDRRGLSLCGLAPSTVTSALALGEFHPLLHRLSGEKAAEDDVCAGGARSGHRPSIATDDLGDHRQVDPDHVALLYPTTRAGHWRSAACRRAGLRRWDVAAPLLPPRRASW